MTEIIVSICAFSVALLLFILSIRSFLEKGFLFNNAYIYASKKERESMNKKPYYRQSGVVFAMVGVMFALVGVEILLKAYWIAYIVIPLAVLLIIYAVISTVSIEKKK